MRVIVLGAALFLAVSQLAPTAVLTQGRELHRYNDLIAVLERGQAVFGSFASHIDADGAAEAGANPELDYVIYPTEVRFTELPLAPPKVLSALHRD